MTPAWYAASQTQLSAVYGPEPHTEPLEAHFSPSQTKKPSMPEEYSLHFFAGGEQHEQQEQQEQQPPILNGEILRNFGSVI